MKLSDFDPLGNTGSLIAGEALLAKDLLEVDGFNGKAYKVDRLGYAAVGQVSYGTDQTSIATGRVLAQTSIVASISTAESRQALLSHSVDESIFTLSADSTVNLGTRLSKFSAEGVFINSVVLVAANATNNRQILELSNGNLAVLYAQSSNLYYAVYTKDLVEVKAVTAISTLTANSNVFGATALSAGGFAAVFHDGTTALDNKLVTFDNSGTAVLAETTVWTRSGTSGLQHHRMVQLSDGNLAIAINSINTVSSIGLFYGVVTPAGASVKAFTNLNTNSTSVTPEITTLGAFFAVASYHATAFVTAAYIFNNAGTQQGSTLTQSSSGGSGNLKIKLLAGSTDFFLVWHNSTGSLVQLTRLPTAGTGNLTTDITPSPTTYNYYVDAFYSDGVICILAQNAANLAPKLMVVDESTGALVSSSSTIFGVVPGTTGGTSIRVVSGGDRVFIAMYDYATTAGTHICIGKYINTGIIGVAQAGAVAAEPVRFHAVAGVYETTLTAGALSSGIDHSTNTVVGQKGTILPYGAVLKGIGV